MEIGYAEILEIYRKHHSMYICVALRGTYDEYQLDPMVIMKQIGIDVYGPIVGRLRFWYGKLQPFFIVDGAYGNIHKKLKTEDPVFNNTEYAAGVTFRMVMLKRLVEHFPNTKFKIAEFS